jgi:hypothetical protein
MTRPNCPSLSKATILGAVDRHGLTLSRGVWKIDARACAAAAYAVACKPELAKKRALSPVTIQAATGLSWTEIFAMLDGFEGWERNWVSWLLWPPYRLAYRVGREVWQEAERRAKARLWGEVRELLDAHNAILNSVPAPSGDCEPVLASVGADVEDFELTDHWREFPG